MKLAVVAYPSLDEGDRQWIESFRANHDPQASRIGVHFTLVFPVEGLPREIEPEIAVVARSTQPISFAIRRTEVVRDALGHLSHIFLVPDEGGVQITTLHSRLYAGTLRSYRRSDIPFVPHMTVGATPDSPAAQRLADELNIHSRMVLGTVGHIDLVDVGTSVVQAITSYALGSAAGTVG